MWLLRYACGQTHKPTQLQYMGEGNNQITIFAIVLYFIYIKCYLFKTFFTVFNYPHLWRRGEDIISICSVCFQCHVHSNNLIYMYIYMYIDIHEIFTQDIVHPWLDGARRWSGLWSGSRFYDANPVYKFSAIALYIKRLPCTN